MICPGQGQGGVYDSALDAYDGSVGGFEMTPSTAIVTVAGLVPDGIDVTLCNETTQEVDFAADVDVVGITANVAQAWRGIEIADAFRRRGKTVVMGGAHVSLSPDFFADHCDSLLIGELEEIAETFFADMMRGTLKPRYVSEKADMTHSPIPRWDLYPHDKVISGVVQASRGCPFKCTFCDVIQLVGNTQRHKTTDQFLAEVQNLYDLGFFSIFIADDNFTANRKVARSLLAAIEAWNGADGRDFVTFQTQMSINMTRDVDLLDSCYRAGVLTNFVGLETSSPAALAECDKRSNQNVDLVSQCETSVRHGVRIEPALIVGFDSDDTSIFRHQLDFAMQLPAGSARIGPLIAPIATPLFDSMKQSGRLVNDPMVIQGAPPYYITNFQPAQMTRSELYIGLRWLISHFYDPENFLRRLGKLATLLIPPPWIARGRGYRRTPRPITMRFAASVLKESVKADPRMKGIIDRAMALARQRPEVSNELNDATIRYLAIFTSLIKNGVFDPTWIGFSEPPFDMSFVDERLEHIRAVDRGLVASWK